MTGYAYHTDLWAISNPSLSDTLKSISDGTEGIHRYGADCSCECKFFNRLQGPSGGEWGVCFSQGSPRAGLLTFHKLGCASYEKQEEEEEEDLRDFIADDGFLDPDPEF